MSLDGIFLHRLCDELKRECIGAKVERVNQPQRDELFFILHTPKGNKKLIVCCNPNSARAHLTNIQRENPIVAPMFCMLLRKHLGGARIVDVIQNGVERALEFVFEAYDEMGDKVEKRLVIEIMGRFSNVIVVDEKGLIIDSMKRVDITTSSQRLVLPRLKYEAPPPQEKLYPLTMKESEIMQALSDESVSTLNAPKALLDKFLGLSPIVAREISYRAGVMDVHMSEMSDTQLANLSKEAYKLFCDVNKAESIPCILTEFEDRKPVYFSYTDISQYGDRYQKNTPSSFSELLDEFYSARDEAQLRARRAAQLSKLVGNNIERAAKKLSLQHTELEDAKKREHLKLYGDLITANMYRMEQGDDVLVAQNYFEEDLPEIKIKLDARLSPSQNAQKYYKDYRRKKSAEAYLTEQIEYARAELTYLESVQDALSRAATTVDLAQIREELSNQGYKLDKANEKPQKKNKKQKPSGRQNFVFLEYMSESGIKILCGKNNLQNDYLTLEYARPDYIWLHSRNIPGAHVIICESADMVDDDTLHLAARIAAANCAASKSPKVEIDYTQVRYVKRAAGRKPGMVYYVKQRTVIVEPYMEEN